MNTRNWTLRMRAALAALAVAGSTWPAVAQVPVDEYGNEIAAAGDGYSGADAIGDEGVPLRSASELETLIGPIALYPDDLLAIVLPAAAYPLQVVEAARFLEDREADPSLKPDEDWDDAIVALLNYPEIVELLNEDLDWTWQLGEAVVAQQADVIAAIAAFRDKAYAAGNLKTDEYQTVTRNDDDIIEIEPVSEEVIYVPYYEPANVVIYQPRPVYYYYPRPHPVYYYPYPPWHSFWAPFYGVTTAYLIGWNTHCVSVYHPTFYGHPYYGYSYYDTWWYRRPSVTVYNNYYYDRRHVANRYEHGDRWRPQGYTRLHHDDQRITRNRYYPNPATAAATREGRNVAAGQRMPLAGNAPARVTRSRTDDSVREIRQALEASGSDRSRNVAVPRAGNGNGRAAAQRASVREVRDALAASRETPPATNRETRRAANRAPTADRPALPADRPTVPSARPAVPSARPDATVERRAVPAQRPTIRTWSDARAAAGAPASRSAQSAPPPSRSQSAPAPVQRAPANAAASRQVAPRPAPAARAPASSARAESRTTSRSTSSRSAQRPSSRTR